MSDVLPEEAIISGMVETFPLDADPKALAAKILSLKQDRLPRTGQRALLEKLGYGLETQIKTMEAIYDTAGSGQNTFH